jgi:hypothetical protein
VLLNTACAVNCREPLLARSTIDLLIGEALADTATSTGPVLSGIAEFERDLIPQRTNMAEGAKHCARNLEACGSR